MNEAPSDRPLARTEAAVLLFIVCCVLSSLRLIRTSPNPADPRPDEVARRSERRFTAVKEQLPSHGVIGYVGESGNSGTEDYYLAQYALAPLVVERSANHSLVIGSFPDSAPVLPASLRAVKDFGNGVLLLSSKDAK